MLRNIIHGPWATFTSLAVLLAAMACRADNARLLAATTPSPPVHSRPAIEKIDPPENGFFSKLLDYEGIAIKAHADVSDEAMYEARRRLAMQLEHLPSVADNLKKAGAELHIIGCKQVTSDLPEHRHLKGKPFEGKLTVDQRTRGLGGLLTSCAEENLLKLSWDHYRGRDICVHEFGHNIFEHGVSDAVRRKFGEQRKRSLERGLWVNSYAGKNDTEFFAELTMWYFGTHGAEDMKGKVPRHGREGLKEYDPEAFSLFEKFYTGQMEPTAATSRAAG